MNRIRFFTLSQVDDLKSAIVENLDWYRDEQDAPPVVFTDYNEMKLTANLDCFEALNDKGDEEHDKENIIAVYTALKCLSPQQAADERIWVYATHVAANKYTRTRWSNFPKTAGKSKKGQKEKTENEKEVEIKKRQIKHVQAHYFARDARGLIRNNAVARLWWMGYAASRCKKDYDLEKTLTILLKNSDVRANLLERTSASASAEIFNGVIRVLGKALYEKQNLDIYKRDNFREFMKRINRQGGRIMLNALSPEQLDKMFQRFAKEAIENGATN